MTHNYAVLRHAGEFLLVGGRHREPTRHDDGVWLARSRTWRWNESVHTPLAPTYLPRRGNRFALPPEQTGFAAPVRLFGGEHPGCVERRSRAAFPYLVPRGEVSAVARGTVEPAAGAGAPLAGAPLAAACEFDGRLSLAHLNGRFFLYARANTASRGGRFVQASTRGSHRAQLPPQLPVRFLLRPLSSDL